MKLIYRVFLLGFMLANLTACSAEPYCGHLESVAKNPVVERQLKEWVRENVVDKKITMNDVMLGGGMWPGLYWYPTQFDWNLLGFNPDAQIRFVGAMIVEDDNGRIKNIKSVFFGERSRYGILIRLPGATDFGVNPRYLAPVSEDVAIVCESKSERSAKMVGHP